MTKDPTKTLINRGWKAQLSVTGATGFPNCIEAGNVVLPKVSMKFSLRMPPNLNGDEALKNLEKILLSDPPYGAKVTMTGTRCAGGWNCPEIEPYIEKAISDASMEFFKKKTLAKHEGCSVPFMGKLP